MLSPASPPRDCQTRGFGGPWCNRRINLNVKTVLLKTYMSVRQYLCSLYFTVPVKIQNTF